MTETPRSTDELRRLREMIEDIERRSRGPMGDVRLTMSTTASRNGSDRYSVYQFFPNESYECVKRFVPAEEAVIAAHALTHSVGGRIGTTQRVIITDDGDYCVFEWKHSEGVTFPPPGYMAGMRDP